MEHIAISVIVPIYNTKPYLAECIESILAQKINVPIEVLLIDDGSTDAAERSATSTPPVMSACGSSIRRTRPVRRAQRRHRRRQGPLLFLY